ncbi:COP9 signalosome [Baffinella frigidus]|nr:COP9 signalosome [Cryptophyta sp. CCMP2293]
MAAVAPLLTALRTAMAKTPKPDTAAASKTLAELKIAMLSFKSMPGTKTAQESDPQELLAAREAYELGCLLSVAKEDIPGFERHYALVKSCYADYSSVLKASENQHQLQGLNLLCMLAQSKIAEFHTELELIPLDLWETNAFIKFPIKLEQYLMEGSYPMVLAAAGSTPAKSYDLFVGMLSGTVRDAIAESSEAAYESLPMGEALKLLSIKTAGELADYAAMREREWDVDVKAQVVRFKKEKTNDLEVPSKRLIIETLSYAKELERIV